VGPLTQWRGQADTTRGRFGWGFLVSFLLHLPFTPLAALFGLLTLFTVQEAPPEVLPPLTGIPVDLLEGEEAEAPPPATAPPPEPEPAAVEPLEKPQKHEPSEPKIRDAGVADAEPTDAAADADSDAATEGNDAGIQDGGITDPVAASGAERIADVNANVQIKIFSEKIRNHPLARRIGPLIAAVPQWSDFLGPAALDPITDVDRILVWGPQLRDSSEVGALVKVNVSKERVHAAIDAIVRSDPETGAWLDAGVSAATAKVDRAPRVFILPPSDLVIVVPPSAAEKTMKAAPKLKFKPGKGAEVLTARLKTPWRAFRGTGIPFEIPRSIEDARFKVTPDENGGAVLEMIAKDESPEKAAENAETLQRALIAASTLDLGFLGAILGTGRHKIVERIELTAQGSEIHGVAYFTARQLGEIIDFAPLLIGSRQQRRRPNRSDAGSPVAPTTPPITPSPASSQ
jgi:hypothetical protein